MELKGRVAVVTGASKGIGLAIAEELLRQGAKVMICARNGSEVDREVSRLADEFGAGAVAGQVTDVREERQVRDLIQACVRTFGGVDVLINNAGVGKFQPVAEMSAEDWRTMLATNLDGVFYACRHAIPEMRKRGGGFIINIGSLAGKNAFPGGAAYNASKFGLIGFSEALMQEVRYDDIRVAYVMPGSVDTWFGGKPPAGEDSWKISAQDVADVVVDTLTRHPRCLTSRIEMRPSKPPRK